MIIFKIKYETAKYRTATNTKSLHKLLNINIAVCILSHFIPGAHITFKLLIPHCVEHILDKLHNHYNRFSI